MSKATNKIQFEIQPHLGKYNNEDIDPSKEGKLLTQLYKTRINAQRAKQR